MTDRQKKELENYQRLIECKDLLELMEQFDFNIELEKNYYEGINFAPDKERFITNTINILEENLQKRKSTIRYNDAVSIELGEYSRIGFAWVNNGYKAKQSDFITLTQSNLTINSNVPSERRHSTYYIMLAEIARGAITAFHISFLKNQLKLYMEHQITVLTKVSYHLMTYLKMTASG